MFLDANIDVNQLVQQVATAVGQINKAAQPLLLHGWEVYVRQQYLGGLTAVIINAAVFLVTAIAALIALPKLYRWARAYEYSYSDHEGAAYLLPGIISVVTLLIFIFTLNNLTDGIMHMLNPEYYALQDILRQFNL